MSPDWISNAFFYHIYPLGFCGAPAHNDFSSPPQPRLDQIYPWLDRIQSLGVNALYLGPLFESTAHGYDTLDYYHLDRRLGTDETLIALARELRRRGLRLILDGVFNHVGRDFWAFRDLQRNLQHSPYASWFYGLDFSRRSPSGDPFAYHGWAGHYDLVKLNTETPELRDHLFGAVRSWVERFEIDGLRLDAADQLSPDFLHSLRAFTDNLRSDFWLMGESVFGDYRTLAAPDRLHSATNYELYKSLYSAHVDHNYFELAYALNRQFGQGGIYRGLNLYNFADNHDVDRVAASLKDPAHLYPLYCLLMTVPGVPSLYYGSEWGLDAHRSRNSDTALRPSAQAIESGPKPQPQLPAAIARLAAVRQTSKALQHGSYHNLHVSAEQFAFLRQTQDESVVVAVNSGSQPESLELRLPFAGGCLVDLLHPEERFPLQGSLVQLAPLYPCWGRILRWEP